jgi:type IV secretory pathway VirD2 relaxase
MRRVAVKVRLVNLKLAGRRSTIEHLRYVERDGVGPKGEPGHGYSARVDEADIEAFEARSRGDRHQFRFIVSPEDAGQLEDVREYTRQLMDRVESDLATRLDWVAVDHWDTDNPHTHVVLRGKDEAGRDLVISGEYIAHGLRRRACEIATAWLGSRTELEIRQSLTREVEQERWTSLDRSLQRGIENGSIDLNRLFKGARQSQTRLLLLGRLRALERMRLAEEQATGHWTLHPDSERILRALGDRGDIIRTMQRAMGADARAIVILDPREQPQPVVGRVLATGMTERDDRSYLVLDGIDGRAYFVPMKPGIACEARLGAIVEVRGAAPVREIDKSIAEMAKDGIYRTSEHFAQPVTGSRGHLRADVIQVHVRRLEALRRGGIVERVEDGVWRVPADLPAQGAEYDVRKRGHLVVEVRSHLPLEQQVRGLGATWLDRQLIKVLMSILN